MKFLVIGGIDLSQNKETEIQLQYIEKCKELLAKSSTKRPTFHIQNEGLPDELHSDRVYCGHHGKNGI